MEKGMRSGLFLDLIYKNGARVKMRIVSHGKTKGYAFIGAEMNDGGGLNRAQTDAKTHRLKK
jgi:hypothetical protein